MFRSYTFKNQAKSPWEGFSFPTFGPPQETPPTFSVCRANVYVYGIISGLVHFLELLSKWKRLLTLQQLLGSWECIKWQIHFLQQRHSDAGSDHVQERWGSRNTLHCNPEKSQDSLYILQCLAHGRCSMQLDGVCILILNGHPTISDLKPAQLYQCAEGIPMDKWAQINAPSQLALQASGPLHYIDWGLHQLAHEIGLQNNVLTHCTRKFLDRKQNTIIQS